MARMLGLLFFFVPDVDFPFFYNYLLWKFIKLFWLLEFRYLCFHLHHLPC